MKKIIITGNLGYIGSLLGKHLKENYTDLFLIGIDAGYFSQCITDFDGRLDHSYDLQYHADVRDIDLAIFNDAYSVVHLAAISNDPMGNKFEAITEDVNRKAVINISKHCISKNVKSVVFASSCSMYGAGNEIPKSESDALNPLTAYARSKIGVENDLDKLNKKDSIFTSLRFSTACGFSGRTRLDLVLNDFVASAIATKKILINSDGSPWRPLIDVLDMCRAIEWAIFRDDQFNHLDTVNIGSNEFNYQVKDIAYRVSKLLGNVEVLLNENAQPDKRSYCVNFDLFNKIANKYIPTINLDNSIENLYLGLSRSNLIDENFRNSRYIRLNRLEYLMKEKLVDRELRYVSNKN